MTAQVWLKDALEGSGWSWSEILEGVRHGDFFIFENDTAALLGEFIISPRHKVMHIWGAGGDMAGVKSLIPMAEQFGISRGCDIGGATGRKGWLRALQDQGYSPANPAVEKEL